MGSDGLALGPLASLRRHITHACPRADSGGFALVTHRIAHVAEWQQCARPVATRHAPRTVDLHDTSITSTAASRSPDAAADPFFDETDARATWRFLAHARLGVTEVRVISRHHEVLGIGFFDDEESLVSHAVCVSGKGDDAGARVMRPYLDPLAWRRPRRGTPARRVDGSNPAERGPAA